MCRLTTPFSLEYTLECGQAFRWDKIGDWWYGIIGEGVVKIRQVDDRLLFQASEAIDDRFIARYFRLDDDLPNILSQINKDEHIGRAVQSLYGLRILRQDPWECLASYICATYVNIPAIRRMIFNLSKRFGKEITFDGRVFYTFPKPGDLVNTSTRELQRCGLGFRAKRFLETSKIVYSEEVDLEALKKRSYEKAKRELLALPGVGHKVADCVLLFSMEKLEAFPVDIWMRRIILEAYPHFFKKSFVKKILEKRSISSYEYEKISSFGRRYFGKYAGYAQEYLFHFRRSQLLRCVPLNHA